jgi:hypothetical protein
MSLSAAAVTREAEALTLCVELLADDVEHMAELSALSTELRNGALVVLARVRAMIDTFAKSLPPVQPPKKTPYTGPRGKFHAIAEKVLANGQKQ